MRGWADGWGAELTEMPGGFVVRGKSLQCRARRLTMNLATDFAKLRLPESALVTCSALLDLVSESWLRGVAGRCRDSGAIVMFALTYDGQMSCKPADSEDAHVRLLVNRHQLTDKGFGPALGPAALDTAETIFAELRLPRPPGAQRLRLGAGDRELCARSSMTGSRPPLRWTRIPGTRSRSGNAGAGQRSTPEAQNSSSATRTCSPTCPGRQGSDYPEKRCSIARVPARRRAACSQIAVEEHVFSHRKYTMRA